MVAAPESVIAVMRYHSVAHVAPEVRRIPLPRSSGLENPAKIRVPSGNSSEPTFGEEEVVWIDNVPPVAVVAIEAWVKPALPITRAFCPTQFPTRAPAARTESVKLSTTFSTSLAAIFLEPSPPTAPPGKNPA